MKSFSFYAAVSALIAAVAALVVALLPVGLQSRGAAWLGVALATASGAIALLLKRRAMAVEGLESLATGLKALGQVMVVRAVVLAVGLIWVARRGDGVFFFVGGFFVVYFGQQWLEISYLLASQKRHSLPKVEAR